MKRETLEVECWFLIPLVRDSDRGLHQPVLWRLLEEALSDAWGGWTGPETMRWGRTKGAVPGGWKPEASDPITDESRKLEADCESHVSDDYGEAVETDTAQKRLHRLAELHWYEAHGIGKKEFKRKRYLD